MKTHLSILAWKIPWMEDLVGYSPQGHKEQNMTEVAQHALTDYLQLEKDKQSIISNLEYITVVGNKNTKIHFVVCENIWWKFHI